MRIIPLYTWNKRLFIFRDQSKKLSREPWFQGVILLCCVVLAMLVANLPFTRDWYHTILNSNLQIHYFSSNRVIDILFPREMTLEKFINDILMVVFFFEVGLEIKREIREGELSSLKKASMPIVAAFGGVIVPATIYLTVNHGTAVSGGFGIPTATDIAFAVCILTVLGDKVPTSMKVFLTALAIADDLIAILILAIFYGGKINFLMLGLSLIVIGIILLMRKVGEKRIFPFLFMAFLVWVLFYYSGIHATMSGIVMAFLIPSNARYTKSQYYRKRELLIRRLDSLNCLNEVDVFPNSMQKHYLRELVRLNRGTTDMSYRVEHALSPWVNYLIIPIFALANAGVTFPDLSYFNIFTETIAGHPEFGMVGLGIFLGLVIGKPVGITLSSWIAIKLGIGEKPEGSSWPMFFAVACLGGIGFTMSLFVDTLSFGDITNPDIITSLRNAGKVAVLLGSTCAGIVGSVLVNFIYKMENRKRL